MTALPSLYAIVDADAAARAGWQARDLARAFLAGGARLLQLRAKALDGRDFLALARAVMLDAHAAAARVIVNDRVDLAMLSGADGVHVGQDDLAPADVRRLIGPEAVVGLSTHAPEQVDAALTEPISYLAIGPVFGTSTKDTGYAPIGYEAVTAASVAAGRRGVPVVAIGGITMDTAAAVLAAGAASVAVIADLIAADPESRVRQYVAALQSSRRPV